MNGNLERRVDKNGILNGFACLASGMLLREVLNGFGIKICSVKGFLICLVAAIVYIVVINLIFK